MDIIYCFLFRETLKELKSAVQAVQLAVKVLLCESVINTRFKRRILHAPSQTLILVDSN